ncbi:MAG: FtsX-like permease family protein [Rhodospirillales bacterium]
MARSLRPARADDLGLRRALSDRLLPLLVAAMTFLAALALAGAMAAAGPGGALAHRRREHADGAGADAGGAGGRRHQGGSRHARAGRHARDCHVPAAVGGGKSPTLLKPWLRRGSRASVAAAAGDVRGAAERRSVRRHGGGGAAGAGGTGTLVERNGAWLTRLADLVRSLRACAALALLVVAFVASAVVAVATRAGLAARRDAIEIVHGLGATDGMIASQFAERVMMLAVAGALLGVLLVLPVLLGLASLAAPFATADAQPLQPAQLLRALPPMLWAELVSLRWSPR